MTSSLKSSHEYTFLNPIKYFQADLWITHDDDGQERVRLASEH